MEKENPIQIQTETTGLDTQAAEEAAFSYRDYWPEFIDSHSKIIKDNPHIKEVAKHTDKFRKRTESAINDGWQMTGRDASTEAKNFYLRLGSLNRLHGAGEVLAEAGLVMQRRAEAKSEKPGEAAHEYLLSGCMFHEAGLVSRGNFRESMFSRALAQYQVLAEGTGNSRANVNNQRALRYSYDLQFQRLFDAIEGDRVGPEAYRSMHEDLQLLYIDEFLAYMAQVEANEATLRQRLEAAKGHRQREELHKKLTGNYLNARGLSLEWFSVLAYRRFIDNNSLHESSFVRSAFPREEEPWFFKGTKSRGGKKKVSKQMPRHGFDILVIDKDEEGVITTRPIQLKVGRGGGSDYLPEIEKIGFDYNDGDKLLNTLRTAARVMGKEYRNQPLRLDEQRALRTSEGLVRDHLVAA